MIKYLCFSLKYTISCSKILKVAKANISDNTYVWLCNLR